MSVPPAYKVLVSVIKRAEELEKSSIREERVVAYYCRLYSVTKATKLSKTPNADELKFITEQMSKLETLKPTLNVSAEEGQKVCREHAHMVFNKADEIDRAGMADKAIAKLFYAAGTFFDILEQFGELDKEIQEKKKYAKWKATDILNAINEGRLPTPGGFGDSGLPNEEDASSASASIYTPAPEIPSAPDRSPSTFSSGVVYSTHLPPTAPVYTPSPAPAVSPPAPVSNFQPPKAVPVSAMEGKVKDTIELCSFAISSLKHNDIQTAKQRLLEALNRLG